MTERDAFIAAIVAAPADDLPRCAFADWLAEHDEPELAEFICVQIRLDESYRTLPCFKVPDRFCRPPDACPGCWDRFPLLERQRVLLRSHWGAWAEGLPDSVVTKPCPSCEDGLPDYETGVVECRRCDSLGVVPDDSRIEFRRGFVAGLDLTWTECVRHLSDIRRRHPIEHVEVADVPGCTVEHRHPAADRYRVTLVGVAGDMFYEVGARTLRQLDSTAVSRMARDSTAALLSRVWPGVTFSLPPPERFGDPFPVANRRARGEVRAGDLLTINPDGTVSSAADIAARAAVDRHQQALARAVAARLEVIIRHVTRELGPIWRVERLDGTMPPTRRREFVHQCPVHNPVPGSVRDAEQHPPVFHRIELRPDMVPLSAASLPVSFIRGQCEDCRTAFVATFDRPQREECRAAIVTRLLEPGDRPQWLGPPNPHLMDDAGNFGIAHLCGAVAPAARETIEAAADPARAVSPHAPPPRAFDVGMLYEGVDVGGQLVMFWRGRCERCRTTFVASDW